MPLLLDATRLTNESPEFVPFPWAHVEDFRHFFGIDHLLEYTRKRSTESTRAFARLTLMGNSGRKKSVETMAMHAIAIGHALEMSVTVTGKLASFKNLDAAIRADHPTLAISQREDILAAYLHTNKVIEKPSIVAPMRGNNLAALIAHHASDFWVGEHEDLFALLERIEHPMHVRFIASALLRAIPQKPISHDEAVRLVEYFAKWNTVFMRSITECKTTLSDTPKSITMRANLQTLQELTRAAQA